MKHLGLCLSLFSLSDSPHPVLENSSPSDTKLLAFLDLHRRGAHLIWSHCSHWLFWQPCFGAISQHPPTPESTLAEFLKSVAKNQESVPNSLGLTPHQSHCLSLIWYTISYNILMPREQGYITNTPLLFWEEACICKQEKLGHSYYERFN